MRLFATIAVCVGTVGVAQVAADDSAAPAASSSGSERDAGFYIVLGALAVNSAFTIYNLATINTHKPRIYGFGETVLTAPQTLVWGGIALLVDDDAWKPTALALWSAGLAAHGIYTLVRQPESSGTSSRTIVVSFGSRF